MDFTLSILKLTSYKVNKMRKHRLVIIFSFLVLLAPIHAEVVLDGTLGHSGALPGPDYLIGSDLGKQQGGNLFHSFQDFNLNKLESATFSGPDSVSNVISRVTGGNPSNIDGILRSTIPNADMYFLNPYGIMFGTNARLDVQGSFHASTADTLRFADGNEFNARNPEQPLLTVAPISAFGFLTDTPAAINLQDSRLFLPEEKTLSFIGGDLHIDKSIMGISAGRFNFASIASHGEVSLTESGLNLSAEAQRGQIAIEGSRIAVNGKEAGAGDIYIRGGQFELVSSQILGETLGNEDGGVIDIQADNLKLQGVISTDTKGSGNGSAIIIKVADSLTASDSLINANSQSIDNAGDAGSIEIEARQVTLVDTQVNSFTRGTGDGGIITLKVADTLSISRISDTKFPSNIGVGSLSEEVNAGKGGRIEIDANKITLSGMTQIAADTRGSGEGGTVILKTNNLALTNGAQIVSSTLSDKVDAGDAGNIEIESRQVKLTKGFIIGSTWGTGEGGNIIIQADNLELQGSIIQNQTTGSGKSGTIVIKLSDSLTVSDSLIIASQKSNNTGNAGSIEIEAHQVTLVDTQVNSFTRGTGDGGIITLKVADTLSVLRTSDDTIFPSNIGVGSLSEEENAGKAGHIEINAHEITLSGKTRISGDTRGSGKGGTIALKVNNLLLEKGAKIISNTSSEKANAGNAGEIEITARKIMLKDGTEINGDTWGTGNGGSITIKTDILKVLGHDKFGFGGIIGVGSLNEKVVKAGNAGNIVIEASEVMLADGAAIGSSTWGTGNGGSITIKATDTLTVSGQSKEGLGGFIGANSLNEKFANAGKAGNIEIEARQMILTDGAGIGSNTIGTGDSGTIIIKVTEALTVSGRDNDNFGGRIRTESRSQNANAGNAGKIEIKANQITLTDGAGISSNTLGSGEGGTIVIQVTDTLTLSGRNESDEEGFGSAILAHSTSEKSDAGKAGKVEINARQIILRDKAQIGSGTVTGEGNATVITADNLILKDASSITTSTSGTGKSGSIIIKVADTITLSGTDNEATPSGILSNSGNDQIIDNTGKAGNIEIESRQIILTNGAQISGSTWGHGEGGSIIIKVADTLTASDSMDKKDSSTPSGIFSSSNNMGDNGGNAGNVDISANQIVLSKGAQINSDTDGSGDGGAVILKANNLTMTNWAEIISSTFGSGKGGSIIIEADTLNAQLSGILGDSLSTEENAGKGGNIEINARQIMLTEGAGINCSTFGAGKGGTIDIQVADILTLSKGSGIHAGSLYKETNAGNAGEISVKANLIKLAEASEILTTANNAAGGNITIETPSVLYLQESAIATEVIRDEHEVNAGKITIQKPVFVVLNDAKIITRARRGFGGDIKIDSMRFLSSTDKNYILDASSDVIERSGTIVITAPEEDISGSLLILPATLFNVPDLKNQCAGVTRSTLNKLIVIDRNVPPTTPDDPKTHYIRRLDAPKPIK
jgi:filamentous hemagglutinin family protein